MSEAEATAGCPFCRIAGGHLPVHVIAESPRLLAYLDSNPIRPGHLRIIPRAHYPHFNALPPELSNELLNLGQRLADAQRGVFKVDRVGFLFPGGDIFHAQAHAVPLLSASDIVARRGSANGKPLNAKSSCPSDPELAATAQILRHGLAGAAGIGAMP